MNRKLLLLCIGMLLLSSCTKEPDDNAPTDKTPTIVKLTEAETDRLPLLSKNHRRTAETVLAFAESCINAAQPESKTTTADLSICDSVLLTGPATKGTDLNAAPIYVVSRGNGQGFVLVAGDNRISPVLGITEEGDYVEGVNPNFDFMIGRLQEEVLLAITAKESLRDSIYENLRIKLGLDKAPETKADDGLVPDPPGAPDLDVPENFDRMEVVERDMYYEMVYEYGPLLKTKWNQWWPYNSEVDKHYPGCPTGCTATALAQIMAYHKHPSYMAATGHSYLWDKMLNGSWSQEAVSSVGQLMFDLGLSPYLNIRYGTEGSSADIDNIPRAYHAFGYSTSKYKSYDYHLTYQDVSIGRPVHIRGDDGGRFGHAWVADGALKQNCFITYYALFYLGDRMIREIKGATGLKSSVQYIHHNFGWSGLHNGWYGSLDPGLFNVPPKKPNEPNPSDFRKNMQIIIGIQPK